MNNSTKIEILNRLLKIADLKNVRILYACESGSRAWGFESPDSDYDIRFIFTRKSPIDYIDFKQRRDTLDRTNLESEGLFTELYDFVGWDVMKMCGLLAKSNPSLHEWLRSPQIYFSARRFQPFLDIADQVFDPRAAFYHYINMIKREVTTYITGKKEAVPAKKILYMTRGILAAGYCLEEKKAPPASFHELREASKIPYIVEDAINIVLEHKSKNKELEPIDEAPSIYPWILRWYNKYQKVDLPRTNIDHTSTIKEALDKCLEIDRWQ